MKNNLWELAIVVVVLTMLIPGLAMLLAGCGPEVTPKATPMPAAPPADTPVPPPAETSEASLEPVAFDKWVLWLDGPHLRGANIWQAIVIPELDGPEFKGSGLVGPPYAQEDFNRLAAMGANYVSISGPGLFTETPPYTADPGVQAHLDNLLAMIAEADLFATIGFRTGPGRSEFSLCCDVEPEIEAYFNDSMWEDQTAQDAWVEMWRYTAERYRNNPIVAGYKLMVEPNAAGVLLDIYDPDEFYADYADTLYDWNQLYPRIVAGIREVDSDTPILVGGDGWSGVAWLPYLQPTDDPRTVHVVHQYEPQDQYSHQEPGSGNTYPGVFDTDYDGEDDQFDRAWLDNLLSTVDTFVATHGMPVAVDEYGLNRWVPGAAEFMDDQMALFEERGVNYALWEWQTSWEPFAEDVHDMNFRLGPDPNNRTDVESSDLIEVIVEYWGRNTIRPSNLATAAPVPAAPPTDTPVPLPAETEEAGGLIDDFEGGDFDDRWWSYADEGTVSFACTLDQPGHASAHATRLTFEVGADGYPSCGIEVDPGQWGDAGGLSFFWRGDQPGLTAIVVLEMEDPTQTHPEAEGMTPFEVELQTPGEEWTPVMLEWDDFARAEWVGGGGVDVLGPTRVVALYFEVLEEQSGSVWFDDLQLMMDLAATSQPVESSAAEPAASESTLQRDFALPIPLFAPDSAWNQTAAGAAVLPDSDQQILATYRVLRGDTSTLYPPGTSPINWPFMVMNYDEYTIPVFRAGAGQQSVLICDYDGIKWWPPPKFGIEQEGGPVTVPAPAGSVRPAGPQGTEADGWLVIYDTDTFMAYDYFAATTQRDAECQSWGGGFTGTQILEAGAIDFFDVRGSGTNPDTYSSARAHGTPLLAGMILPEDVESGAIAHALAVAIPGPRNTSADPSEPLSSDYFYPASTTETDFYNTDPYALAAGQRIRLKQTIVDDDEGNLIDESQLAPITQMFLTALRTYGAYLVDNAGGFAFYAEDSHTAVLHLTDDQVNALIGQPAGTPLPAGKTKWQVVIDQLNLDLELIPFAYDESWQDGQNPATATIEISNFEVVEPATRATAPPAAEPAATPTRPLVEPVADKWDLWTDGPRLRGADLHPCWVTYLNACAQFTTRQDVQDLRNLGANLINASYPGVFTEQPPYQVDPTALAYLDDLIAWAEEVGIYVVIHFRTGPGRNEVAIHAADDALYTVWSDQAAHEAWIEMWRFTAERYRDNPVVVGYNLMVEPHVNTLIDPDGELDPLQVQAQVEGTLMDWNAFAAEITEAIRQVDSDTPIIVNSLNWGDTAWFSALQLTGDARTIYSLHAYNPDVYTNQDEGEISISYPDVVEDYGETITFNRTWLEEDLRPAAEFAQTYDVPVYVGEFGAMRWVPGAVEFLRDQTALFEQYGWNYAYYTWRADDAEWDGFNLEYGPDPGNHTPIPDNPLLGVFRDRWAQNVDFPGNPTAPAATPTSAPAGGDWWKPAVNTTWQWQLDQPIDQSFDVDMYDIDLFDSDASAVAALHAQGRKVVCYISVGSWEDWRPDKDQFPASVIGKDYGGWPGEKWLDIRQIDLLAPIMRARLDECKARGFDGIEPDNIDGYTNDTDFPLTYEDQLKYNIWLTNEAHARGLSIGLKNDPDQVTDLLPYFDWALTEDCFAEGWCEEMLPFVAAGKPVFAAEYTDQITSDQFFNQICPQVNAMNFDAILKNRDLDTWRQACP